MVLHQAVFGPLNGHALLSCTSREFEAVFRDAAFRTDLPQTAPPDIVWQPFHRLVEHDDWLLFVHTRPAEPGVRAGMVRSRAVLIPKAEVRRISSLTTIASELRRELAIEEPLYPIEVSAVADDFTVGALTTIERAIAEGLVRTGLPTRPLVALSQDGFDYAMLRLWSVCPWEMRPSLTFGLSFGPNDVQGLAVVATPKPLQGRWDAEQLVLEPEHPLTTPAEVVLNVGEGKTVREFASRTGISLSNATVIRVVADAVKRFQGPPSVASDISVLRIVTERGGVAEPLEGPLLTVITRLSAARQHWTLDHVLSMRNMELGVGDGVRAVHEALQKRVPELLSDQSASPVELLRSLAHGKAKEWWLNAAKRGAVLAFEDKRAPEALFAAVWQLMLSSQSEVAETLLVTKSALDLERRLVLAMPTSVDSTAAIALAPALLLSGLPTLAGKVLGRAHGLTAALANSFVLSKECPHESRRKLLEGLFDEFSDEEVVMTAVSSVDHMVLEFAVAAILRTPEVLQRFDWAQPSWYQLLTKLLVPMPNAVDLLPNASRGMGLAIAAQLADEGAWAVIGRTKLADLSSVMNRASAWPLVPAGHLDRVLNATAEGWLRSLDGVTSGLVLPEEPLAGRVRELVASPRHLAQVARRAPASLATCLEQFGLTSEQVTRDFLEELLLQRILLGEAAAIALGQSIQRNRWRGAADRAAESFYARPDFHPLVRACYQVLSPLNMVWLAVALHLPLQLSGEQAWDAFESEAAALYGRGPTDRELWARSGGDDGDLDLSGSGREQWSRCVRALRHGMAPGVEAVLREIAGDYRNRDVIPQLLRLRFWERG